MTLKLNAVNTVSHYESVVYAYRYIVCLNEYLSLNKGVYIYIYIYIYIYTVEATYYEHFGTRAF